MEDKNNTIDLKESIMDRDKVIVRTSVIGIITNVLLAAFKAIVGVVAHSIAVTLDAVNNLSDALSSIITIIGTKLAGKLPDKKHPLGYGRIEYLSAMIVSGLVLYAGITAAVESIKKIIHPETPDYSTVSLIIIAVAIVVKIVLGRYVKAQGQRVNSGSLIASGSDALFDAILSTSVLVSAIIFILWGISLEAWVGVVIAAIIIKSGIEMMIDTLNEILGIRADKVTTDRIKALLNEDPAVQGAYDLVIYNYGPNKILASVHLELPDTMQVTEIDKLTRKLETKVFRETGVFLSAIGVYSFQISNPEVAKMRNEVTERVMAHAWALQVHGFFVDLETKEMHFDVVLSFDILPKEGLAILYKELGDIYPDYNIVIAPDVDVTVSDLEESK